MGKVGISNSSFTSQSHKGDCSGKELPVKLIVDTSLADTAYKLAAKWDQARKSKKPDFSMEDIDDFSAKQVSLLLDTLVEYPAFDKQALETMDGVYQLSSNGNPEINVSLPAAHWSSA